MKNETELELKRAYWSGVYFTLDPERREVSEKTAKMWVTAEVWITAINWALGKATNSAAILGESPDDSQFWDT
jgi:hypothetical protein